MKKKIIAFLCCGILLIMSGCQRYNGSRLNIDKDENVMNIEVDYSLQSIAKIRGTADEVIKQAQEGRWSNLKFNKFNPYISPDAEELYNITIRMPSGNYKGLEREDLLNEQIKFIESFYPDITKGKLLCDDGVIVNDEYIPYTIDDEFISKMRDKNVTENCYVNPSVVYKEHDGVPGHGSAMVNVNHNFYDIFIDRNVIANTWADMLMEQGASPEAIAIPGLSIWFCEMVDYSYSGNTDGSLDKKWKLLNGEMSIREGIEFVENYMNNELQYETNPDIKSKVYGVDVMKVRDGVYAFHFRMRREIYGLVTQAGWPVMSGDLSYHAEGATVEMIETDKIDVIYSNLLTAEIEKTSEPITEIISMEAAIDMVSKEIGVNSSYQVESLELAYDVLGAEIQGKGKPVWRFVVSNEKSEYAMVFSVDAVTGKVKYREM